MALEFESYKNALADQVVLIVGAGNSLLNVPPAMFMTYPTITMNFVPYWYPFIKFNYYVALDYRTLVEIEDILEKGTTVFLPERMRRDVMRIYKWGGEVVFYNIDEKIKGVPYGEKVGASFHTSIGPAAWLACYMGAKNILLLGFDCTWAGLGEYYGEGKTNGPHFYDPIAKKEVRYQKIWDEQIGALEEHALRRYEARILNISKPTKAICVSEGKLSDFWPLKVSEV